VKSGANERHCLSQIPVVLNKHGTLRGAWHGGATENILQAMGAPRRGLGLVARPAARPRWRRSLCVQTMKAVRTRKILVCTFARTHVGRCGGAQGPGAVPAVRGARDHCAHAVFELMAKAPSSQEKLRAEHAALVERCGPQIMGGCGDATCPKWKGFLGFIGGMGIVRVAAKLGPHVLFCMQIGLSVSYCFH
jgi:hypothetical protein